MMLPSTDMDYAALDALSPNPIPLFGELNFFIIPKQTEDQTEST